MIESVNQQYIYEQPLEGTIFQEKRCNVKRIPSIEQVQDFLSLFPYGTRWNAFYTTAFFCGLRPCELTQLTTDDIIVTEGRWTGLIYKVGKPKPTGRPKNGEAPTKAKRKWNRIDEAHGDIPANALHSLQTYWRLHHQKTGLLFPKAYSQYGKAFSTARIRMIRHGHENWANTAQDYFRRLVDPSGNEKHEHDITPYSARRFFISCYHWLISPENRNTIPDLLQTQRRMAHSSYKDTAGYIYNWRDLGISANEIGQGWNILSGKTTNQRRLSEF